MMKLELKAYRELSIFIRTIIYPHSYPLLNNLSSQMRNGFSFAEFRMISVSRIIDLTIKGAPASFSFEYIVFDIIHYWRHFLTA